MTSVLRGRDPRGVRGPRTSLFLFEMSQCQNRQNSVVSTGTLCPEFTGTGRVTQTPASKDGEAESGLELPPSSQDQSGNEENRAEG